MPLEAFTWAVNAPIKDPTTFRILLVLVDHADESGLCWPLVSTIARRAHRSDSTVRSHLDRLEEQGYVARHRLRNGGRYGGFLYRVLFPGAQPVDNLCLPRFVGGDVDLPEGWYEPTTAAHQRWYVGGDHRRLTGGQEPPTREPPTHTGVEPTPEFVDGFWKPYCALAEGRPTQAGTRKRAWMAFRRLSEQDRRAAVESLPVYARWLEVQDRLRGAPHPAKHASTYLNERYFDDVQRELDGLSSTPAQRPTRDAAVSLARAWRSLEWDDVERRLRDDGHDEADIGAAREVHGG